jgi:hypothetical protein
VVTWTELGANGGAASRVNTRTTKKRWRSAVFAFSPHSSSPSSIHSATVHAPTISSLVILFRSHHRSQPSCCILHEKVRFTVSLKLLHVLQSSVLFVDFLSPYWSSCFGVSDHGCRPDEIVMLAEPASASLLRNLDCWFFCCWNHVLD